MSCNGCGERMPSGQSGQLCALCLAKMINYADGEYDDDNDPAIKLFKRKLAEQQKPASSNGCAVVVLAAVAVPAAMVAAGLLLAR